MATKVKISRVVKKPDGWWVPRCPPHYMRACGPYETKEAAESDRLGMEQTINSPAWRNMMMDLEEEEEEDS